MLLRAKPPKGGDAELRDYRNVVAKSAEPPAMTHKGPGWRLFFLEVVRKVLFGRIAPLAGGARKGKPGESRGRKATRLPHAVLVPASRAAEPPGRGYVHSSHAVLGSDDGGASCGLRSSVAQRHRRGQPGRPGLRLSRHTDARSSTELPISRLRPHAERRQRARFGSLGRLCR